MPASSMVNCSLKAVLKEASDARSCLAATWKSCRLIQKQ